MFTGQKHVWLYTKKYKIMLSWPEKCHVCHQECFVWKRLADYNYKSCWAFIKKKELFLKQSRIQIPPPPLFSYRHVGHKNVHVCSAEAEAAAAQTRHRVNKNSEVVYGYQVAGLYLWEGCRQGVATATCGYQDRGWARDHCRTARVLKNKTTTTEKSGCIKDASQCTASMNLYLLNSFLHQFLLIWSDILAEFTDYVSDCYEMTGKESPKPAEREEGLKKTTSVRVTMRRSSLRF